MYPSQTRPDGARGGYSYPLPNPYTLSLASCNELSLQPREKKVLESSPLQLARRGGNNHVSLWTSTLCGDWWGLSIMLIFRHFGTTSWHPGAQNCIFVVQLTKNECHTDETEAMRIGTDYSVLGLNTINHSVCPSPLRVFRVASIPG